MIRNCSFRLDPYGGTDTIESREKHHRCPDSGTDGLAKQDLVVGRRYARHHQAKDVQEGADGKENGRAVVVENFAY